MGRKGVTAYPAGNCRLLAGVALPAWSERAFGCTGERRGHPVLREGHTHRLLAFRVWTPATERESPRCRVLPAEGDLN